MVWKPHVTVAAVIERQGRFLLVEECPDGGAPVYNQPAGHLEPGEGLIEATIRETLEETARVFAPQALTGIYRWYNPDNDTTFLRICLSGHCGEQDPTLSLDEGILGTVWLSVDELRAAPERLRSPMVLRCIEDYLAGNRYPLELLQDVS